MRDLRPMVASAVLLALLIFSGLGSALAQDSSSAPAAQSSATPAAQQPAAQQPSAQQNEPPNAPAPGKAQPRTAKLTDYSKPRSHFPNPIAPYEQRQVPEASLQNSPRIEQIYQNGKVMLSLNDAIALALENNLDIAIARYNLNLADTDILRAKAGQNILGVPTGVVQGTPGGGVGGFGVGAQGSGAGGTSGGAGGAAAGTSGIVQSTLGAGSAVESFDPFIQGTLSLEHARFPLSNTVTTGVANLSQNTATGNFSYNQGWASGTDMSLSFDNSRQISNARFSGLQPAINSSFRFQLRQHLLQGFGLLPNLRFIWIAKNDRKISESAFRQQVSTTVAQIQNIYWDLVNAYESVKVNERSVALAQKTLSDNQRQVQIGTLAPIEVVRAQSALASSQQALIVAQTNLELQQSLMKNALTRSLPKGSPLIEAPVIPTDTMQLPAEESNVPIEQLVDNAIQHRPEIEQSGIDLTNRRITEKSAKNALLPTIDLFGFYGASGLAGDPTKLTRCATPSTPGCIPGDTGFSDAFGNLFDSSAPDKGVGVNVLIPIRNRAAQAQSTRSQLEYRQAELRLQQLKNQVGIDVRNAQFALQQNRAQVKAAQDAETLAEQSLDAEQKKYALGASTNTLVLSAQRDLTQAQSNLVSAMAAYEKSRVQLDFVTGNILAQNQIELADAETGNLSRLPAAPYIVPNPNPGSPGVVVPPANPQPPQPQEQQPPQPQEQQPPPPSQ